MISDNRLGVEPPKDANGKDIPLDTKILYTTNGQVFQVGQFRYSVRVNRWFAYGYYEHGLESRVDIVSCFLLTPPDSWDKLLGDLDRAANGMTDGAECRYADNAGRTCKTCKFDESTECIDHIFGDIARRICALREVR